MIDDIKTFGIWKTLKFAWQRVFKGYDDTFYWAMDDYLNYYFVPAIKKFCEERLKNCVDERFIAVYKVMLEKINKFNEYDTDEDYGRKLKTFFEQPNPNSEMWSYFGQNIGYFWS